MVFLKILENYQMCELSVQMTDLAPAFEPGIDGAKDD
jgi:hypothetical protein